MTLCSACRIRAVNDWRVRASGVEVNETEARKHPFQQEVLEQVVFHPDGSVAEW